MSFVQRLGEASDTWLTPRWILDPLGPFDLDPCAAPSPRPWDIAATNYALPNDNGLLKPWAGRVWLNPPYGDKVGTWIERLSLHPAGGTALVFARTEVGWWQDFIFAKASAVLFLRGRVKFLSQDGRKKWNAPAPCALVAYGAGDSILLSRANETGKLPGSFLVLD